MTTIVTTTSNNYAAIVADSGVTSDLMHHDRAKITQQGTWLIAVTGLARDADLYQYAVKYPKPPQHLLNKKAEDWVNWIVTKVIPKIKEQLNPDDKRDDFDAEAILITHGRAFHIGCKFEVLLPNPYWSIGSGAHLAMGTLAQSSYSPDWNKDADLIAKHSIQTAQMHDPYTRGKITGYKSMGSGKVIPI